MALRKPLVVLSNGLVAELPDGDVVPVSAGNLDGGNAATVYTAEQVIDGGDANGD